MKKFLFLAGIIIVLILLFSQPSSKDTSPSVSTSPVTAYTPPVSPLSKGSRALGIDVTEGKTHDFDKSFSIAKELGAEFVQLSIPWDEIEKKPGVLDNEFFAIADSYYPKSKTKVALNLTVIDTTALRVPSYLKDKKLNDPEVITAFEKVIDYAFSQMPHTELLSLSIGNEADIYLNSHKEKWPEYISFYNEIVAYVKSKKPSLKIGVKMTFDGLTINNQNSLELNKQSDVILVTYYPINQAFAVKPTDVVASDFKKLTDIYTQPIYILETGYPSGTLNNSSEAQQAEFIAHVFKAWDTYSRQIKAINFLWLHDLSDSATKGYTSYYGSNSKAFGSYLKTMGLMTYDGTPKAAFTAFKTEAQVRGW